MGSPSHCSAIVSGHRDSRTLNSSTLLAITDIVVFFLLLRICNVRACAHTVVVSFIESRFPFAFGLSCLWVDCLVQRVSNVRDTIYVSTSHTVIEIAGVRLCYQPITIRYILIMYSGYTPNAVEQIPHILHCIQHWRAKASLPFAEPISEQLSRITFLIVWKLGISY